MSEEKELLPEKDAEKKKERKPEKIKLKMTFSILVLAAFFIAELYLMINFPGSYLLIGVAGLAILCFVYLITDYSFKMQNEKESFIEQKFDYIYKGEKVNYVLIKKSFMDLEDSLKNIGNNQENNFAVDDLIHAQKAVGKVTIQRGKENTAEILASIEKLADNLSDFDEKLEEISDIARTPQDHSDGQQEVILALDQAKGSLEGSIKDTISELSEKVSLQISSIPSGASDLQQVQNSLTEIRNLIESIQITAPVSMPQASFDLPSVEEPVIEEEPAIEEPASISELDAAAQSEPELPDPSKKMTNDDIEALLAEMNGTMAQEPDVMPEPEEEPELEVAPEPEVMPEPEPIPEPVEEEKPAMPDLSDPGHVMTPEEIAALLANM